MPALQCPECRMEILPNDRVPHEEHVYCGRCGREIYVNTKEYPKLKCPDCGKVADRDEFNLAEHCCH